MFMRHRTNGRQGWACSSHPSRGSCLGLSSLYHTIRPSPRTPQVGVNKDSYLILDTLPPEYDSRVKAMEVDEKPTEDYSDVGGLDKQIQVRSRSLLILVARGPCW